MTTMLLPYHKSISKKTAHMQNTTSLQLLLSNPPSPQRQALQMQSLRLDKAPECNYTDNNTKHIDNIISISSNTASTASINTDMAVILQSARERFGDEIAFEVRRGDGGRCACCGGEHVDEFEDEEAGECAAEVANTGRAWSQYMRKSVRRKDLRGEESHVGTADMRIGNLCVESADGDEHDGAHEGTEDVLDDDDAEVWEVSAAAGEDHDSELSKCCSNQAAHECPTPKTHGSILFTPLASIVT
jgi:hypothetical protein